MYYGPSSLPRNNLQEICEICKMLNATFKIVSLLKLTKFAKLFAFSSIVHYQCGYSKPPHTFQHTEVEADWMDNQTFLLCTFGRDSRVLDIHSEHPI